MVDATHLRRGLEQCAIVAHGPEQKLHFVVSPFNNESASLKKLSTSSSHGREDCGSIRDTLAGSGVATGLVPITGGEVGVLLAHPAELSSNSAATVSQHHEAVFEAIDVLLLGLCVSRHERHNALQVDQRSHGARGVFFGAVRSLGCQVSTRAGGARAFDACSGQSGQQRQPEHPEQRGLEVGQHHASPRAARAPL